MEVTLPITADTVIDEVRTVSWNERPFVYWEYEGDFNTPLEILAPLWTDILASVVISDSMKVAPPLFSPPLLHPR